MKVCAFCESYDDYNEWKVDGDFQYQTHGVSFKSGNRILFVPYNNIMYIEEEVDE